jgi:hypothetical protein
VAFTVPRAAAGQEKTLTRTSAARHRVVIVGSGFGGLFAAKSLGGAPDARVTSRWLPVNFRYAPFTTEVVWRCNTSLRARRRQ